MGSLPFICTPWDALVFGMSTYAFASDQEIVSAVCRRGDWSLGILESTSGRWRDLALPYTSLAEIRAAERRAVFLAASPSLAPAVISLDLDGGRTEVLRSSSAALAPFAGRQHHAHVSSSGRRDLGSG